MQSRFVVSRHWLMSAPAVDRRSATAKIAVEQMCPRTTSYLADKSGMYQGEATRAAES